MGIFSKKKAPAPPQGFQSSAPVVLTEHDLMQARQLLTRFEQSQTSGIDADVRGAVLAIAQAGGKGSPARADTITEYIWQGMENVSRSGESGIDRPWLAAVGREAYRQGNHELVVHLSLFTHFWVAILGPRMTAGDEFDMRLPRRVPPKALAELFSVALRGLPQADQEAVVVPDPNHGGTTIRVQDLLLGCAIEAIKVKELLDPEAATTASRLVG